MDIINTNRLRVSVRLFRKAYGEYFSALSLGSYRSSDHSMPRLETTYFARALGIVADVKWRPDGKKRSTVRR
jgi:hypothetical protein